MTNAMSDVFISSELRERVENYNFHEDDSYEDTVMGIAVRFGQLGIVEIYLRPNNEFISKCFASPSVLYGNDAVETLESATRALKFINDLGLKPKFIS